MDPMDDGEEIHVTSPTSLAHRNARSTSGSDRASLIQQPSLRTTLSTGRSSLMMRPSSSSSPATWAGNHSNRNSSRQIPSSDTPRLSSNPNLAALNEESSQERRLSSNSSSSLGPNERPTFSQTPSNTLSFMSRRGGTRKSILSLLKSEKETASSFPIEESSSAITCEGFLTKRGHVFTNWKMRYFVLRGNVLEYFASEEKGKRYGSVVVEKVAPWTGEAHGFMFYTSKQVPYYVYASSEAERQKWLNGLKDYYVEPEEVTCEGYLTRRGHLVPSQRSAYHVLNGTTLRHYADLAAYRENQSAIAEVEIRSITSWDGETFGLMFQTRTGTVFYAIADSMVEQQKWISSVPTSQEPIVCSGYLTKQGHKRKSWKKRFFILRGTTLSYYHDHTKDKPLAEVIVEDVQRWNGEPFGFTFMTSEQIPYYVYADNEPERTKWISMLQKVTSVQEDINIEQKRCPNCAAVLTGSRFCGACGFNLRGTTVQRHPRPSRDTNVTIDLRDDMEDEDDTPFDELEALSEGARTLLLAVMQTPEGVDIGGENGFPSRVTASHPTGSNRGTSTFEMDMKVAAEEVDYENMRRNEEEDDEMEKKIIAPRHPTTERPPAIEIPSDSKQAQEIEEEEVPLPAVILPPSPPTSAKRKADPKVTRNTINFAVVENQDVKNTSFTSFGESDEEVKAEPKPVPIVTTTTDRFAQGGVHMGGMGRRKTVGMLLMEDSSEDDEEDDHVSNLPTKPPTSIRDDDQREEKSSEEEEPRTRNSSADSLELDVTGIAVFEEMQKQRGPVRSSLRMSERSSKNDLYHYFERELNFTPVFVPSADAPVRCRLYSSMAYTSAKNVILFISDSGPLGLWRQDLTDHTTTIDHKWSMLRYVSRAQEEGYGVFICNPFTNNAVVYEAGGFERDVPIPHSSTPREHVLFVWEQYLSKIKGQVSVIAYGRGGVLMKEVVESFEANVREKLYRIAFIDSKHEIDPSESYNVRELVGSRSINWEASFEPQGGQVLDSQARVGCVCLSIGFMPPNGQDIELSPLVLKHAEDCVFAFINATPEKTGMSAIVKWVRAEIRKKKHAETTSRTRPNSNILVLGEANSEENSDVSSGTTADDARLTPNDAPKPAYYLPKSSPSPSPKQPQLVQRISPDKKEQITVAKDFDLLQVVGQGGFGKVFLARKRTPPNEGECYAIKVLKKQHVISSNLVTTTMAERRILTEIRHPFVVRLHYAFQDASKLYLVMDYLSGGSLAAHLRRRRKFPEEWARFYAAEIAAAIAHLHSVNIIYRDAKLENVLLDHDGHVRITDFGLSKVGVSDLKGATTFCGTAAYIAPELLKGNTYGKAADWWSFGILLYEMIGGKPPYYHRNRDIMFQTILKQEWVTFSPNFSDSAVSLIRGLLTRDPMMRLGSGPRGADEVLTHSFFDTINWPSLLQRRLQPPFNPGVGKLDTHYAPRLNNNEITARDREGSVMNPNTRQNSDFDGFSFVGRPSDHK